VHVLHAGSLTALVRDGLAPALARQGIEVVAERGFSVDLAEALVARRRTADLFLSADAELSRLLLGARPNPLARWFVVFARNAVVLAYHPSGPFADQFVRASQGQISWYEVLAQPGLRLARDDPYRDPLGYYAVLVVDLAERAFGQPGLRRRVLRADDNPAQVHPDPLGRLLAGEADATFTYRSGAISRGLAWIDLGPRVDLSQPDLAPSYALARMVTPTGGELQGRPIACSAAVIEGSENQAAALAAVGVLVSPAGQDLVREHHLLPSAPVLGGDARRVPDALVPLLGSSRSSEG
jgi:molybdate/tungstate transport system substrate-binding protein